MRLAWRLLRKKYTDKAFDGEGARRYGGRWNSKGTTVVYTRGSLSLAALEALVHLNPMIPLEYIAFPIEFSEDLVEKASLGKLPSDWRIEPPGPATMAIGDAWAKERRSVVFEVPSAIVPAESNFLLNPSHPGFSKIQIGKPEDFAFDPRLVGRGRKD